MDTETHKTYVKTMKHWQQYTLEEQREILEIVAAKISLPLAAVEKDWWVV